MRNRVGLVTTLQRIIPRQGSSKSKSNIALNPFAYLDEYDEDDEEDGDDGKQPDQTSRQEIPVGSGMG
jgi:hypothetical protein